MRCAFGLGWGWLIQQCRLVVARGQERRHVVTFGEFDHGLLVGRVHHSGAEPGLRPHDQADRGGGNRSRYGSSLEGRGLRQGSQAGLHDSVEGVPKGAGDGNGCFQFAGPIRENFAWV